jgi:hypothetical protein
MGLEEGALTGHIAFGLENDVLQAKSPQLPGLDRANS